MTDRRLTVMVADDDPTLRQALSVRMEAWGYDVSLASSFAEAERILDGAAPDVVVADVVLPDAEDLQLLRAVRAHDPGLPVVVVTAHGTADLAIRATTAGAFDFLTKPLDPSRLRAVLACAARRIERAHGGASRRTAASPGRDPGPIVGASEAMEEVFSLVDLLARNHASALLTGEAGTGKELVARTIHARSDRSDGPFVAVDAADAPASEIEDELFGQGDGAPTRGPGRRRGRVEAAHGGTLFLDEIAALPREIQPKLLRVVEDGLLRRMGSEREERFDVRVLAASRRSPAAAVAERRLRDDLFHRLNVFTVHVPSLRERPGDLPLLVRHFVDVFNTRHGLAVDGVSDECLELLEAHAWPGNVRELRDLMEPSVLAAGTGLVRPEHLPSHLRRPGASRDPVLRSPVVGRPSARSFHRGRGGVSHPTDGGRR